MNAKIDPALQLLIFGVLRVWGPGSNKGQGNCDAAFILNQTDGYLTKPRCC